jgi:hypothetical protein
MEMCLTEKSRLAIISKAGLEEKESGFLFSEWWPLLSEYAARLRS